MFEKFHAISFLSAVWTDGTLVLCFMGERVRAGFEDGLEMEAWNKTRERGESRMEFKWFFQLLVIQSSCSYQPFSHFTKPDQHFKIWKRYKHKHWILHSRSIYWLDVILIPRNIVLKLKRNIWSGWSSFIPYWWAIYCSSERTKCS